MELTLRGIYRQISNFKLSLGSVASSDGKKASSDGEKASSDGKKRGAKRPFNFIRQFEF